MEKKKHTFLAKVMTKNKHLFLPKPMVVNVQQQKKVHLQRAQTCMLKLLALMILLLVLHKTVMVKLLRLPNTVPNSDQLAVKRKVDPRRGKEHLMSSINSK